MKKSLLVLSLFGAFAGVAHAQSSVVIYGTVDANVQKVTGTSAAISKHDNNKLGFKGVEDLGNGLKALFQLEIRYELDTGTLEANTRPLFQGQSRVGLQGAFGTVRLGRGLTAYQETSTAFEPWSGMPSRAGFQPDIHIAGYTSDPLSAAGNSRNRFSNALFYNTPVMSGFQLNATVGAKETNGGPAIIGRNPVIATPTPANPQRFQYAANSAGDANPYSLSGTYTNGPVAAMLGYERNAVQTKLWSAAASFNPITPLKLMASYQEQDFGHTAFAAADEAKSWVVGANYTVGSGLIRAGYGRLTPENATKTKRASIGYEHNLSKRTYLYAEASQTKTAVKTNYYGVGVHHNF
ncbi:putative porin [Janthinobacterium sp. CG_23.3]|uniref:porin n=1 Tax=Janthinobacterium sp. CG_23.3 TaxID=3349634 RepID=UPI0038D3AA49